jgi:hypothetical protein
VVSQENATQHPFTVGVGQFPASANGSENAGVDRVKPDRPYRVGMISGGLVPSDSGRGGAPLGGGASVCLTPM